MVFLFYPKSISIVRSILLRLALCNGFKHDKMFSLAIMERHKIEVAYSFHNPNKVAEISVREIRNKLCPKIQRCFMLIFCFM